MYKYIHILRPNEIKFLRPLVDMVNNPENGFKREEHLFVTPHKQVYGELCKENNVVLDETKANLINKYAPECEWLISHDLPRIKEALFTKRRYLKKVVWRTWGGGHQKYNYKKDSFFISIIHRLADWGYGFYYNNVFGKGVIGVANSVDIIDLRTWMKDTPLIPMPYIGSNQYPILKEISSRKKENSPVLKVLLGHQGTVAENHLPILYNLKQYDAKRINIIIPLSYGTKSYIDQLIPEIENLHMPNVTILTDFMEFKDYAELLNSIDVAILDEPSSMALGNMSMLLFFEKKIVLNRDGILCKVLDMNKIPHLCTDELPDISLEELGRDIPYDGKNNDIVLHEYDYYVKQWKNLLENLDKMKGRIYNAV